MKNLSQKITPETASPILGISPNKIREDMRKNKFNPPIGRIRKSRTGNRYDIYKSMVLEYVGLKEWPEEETG